MDEIQRKKVVTSDGVTLYYETQGLREGKSVLFFLHGVGGDADAWKFVRDLLLEKDFSTITMDLRGHGHSGHPKTGQSYEMNYFVSDILSILEQEKINKIILIGHSLGSLMAANFAFQKPEYLQALILISGIYSPPSYLSASWSKRAAKSFINFAASISLKPIRPGHSHYPKGKFHKDYELVGLVRTILRNSWRSYLLSSKHAIDLSLEDGLAKLEVPMLLIAGDKDSVAPLPKAKQVHLKLNRSKLEIIQGANHVVILNNADETSSLIHRFITNFLV